MLHAQNGSALADRPQRAVLNRRSIRATTRARWLLPLTFSLLIGMVASCLPAASASSPIVFGVVGDVAKLSGAANMPLAENRYAQLSAKPPNTKMINMMPGTSWSAIASARPGSSIYANLVRWGNTLKSRPGTTWLAFSHEPEAHKGSRYGTAPQFVAAFRNVVNVIRSTGARNVAFVWQMTAYAFQVSSADPRFANKWYPGSGYVDYISADAYNWVNCDGRRGSWDQLSQVAGPSLNFARANHKLLILGEFASQAGPLRAQWLRNAGAWARANAATVRGLFYFQYRPAGPTGGCNWILSSGADLSAFSAMVHS